MTSELDSDSVPSTPRSEHPPPPPSRWHNDDSSAATAGHRVRLMCSSGGRILPRPQDHQLRYVGGDTRIVAVPRSSSFSTLLSKLSKIAGTTTSATASADQLSIKYQLPNEDLDALISLTSDEDVENMMEEYDRLSASSASGGTVYRTPRIRLFLFPPGSTSVAGAGAFGSILDGSGGSKSDDWFLDALNGSCAAATPLLERGRSEASSVVSEVPDYLFGFDNNSDEPSPLPPSASGRSRARHQESLSFSEPGSPAQVTGSGSLPPIAPATTDRPRINYKPEDNLQVELQVPQQTGYVQNKIWQYVTEPVPVYYVAAPVVTGGSLSGQSAPVPFPYPHQATGGQAPFGYAQPVQGSYVQPVQGVSRNPIQGDPVYVGGTPMLASAYEYPVQAKAAPGEAYEMVAAGGFMRSPTTTALPMYPPTGIAPAVVELPMPTNSDLKTARAQ